MITLTKKPRWLLMLLPLLVCAAPAGAFKISTHVWVADHIIAELGAGNELVIRDINDQTFETVTLPARVTASIRAFPETFRMAATGADIYPDLVAGQMTTHPGLPFQKDMDSVPEDVIALRATLGLPARDADPGWQTDDWLLHVRNEAFRLSPPGQEPTPQIAFAYGYLLHAAMDTWAHSYVNMITGDLFSIVENPTIAARHTALESFFKLMHEKPKLGTKPVAAPAWFVRRTLILNRFAAEQYSRSEAASHLYAMYAWWTKARQLRGQLGPIRNEIDRALTPARTAFEDADALWQTLSEQRDTAVTAAGNALGALNGAESTLQTAVDNLQDATDVAAEYLYSIPPVAALLAAADGAIEDFLSYLPVSMLNGYNQAKTARAIAQTAVDNAQTQLDQAREDRDQLIDDVAAAASDLNIKQAAFQMLDALRSGAWATADGAFGSWVNNIEAAVDAYVLAFEGAGRRIMQPASNRFQKSQSNLEPVKQWAACWGPAFGLPLIPQLHNSCAVSLERYSDLRASVTALKNNLLVPQQFPTLRALILAFDDAVQEATADGLALVGGMIGRAVPSAAGGDIASGAVAFASTMWDHDVQPQDLEDLFLQDGSGVGLPLFGPGRLFELLQEDGLPVRWTTDSRSRQKRLDLHTATLEEMMAFTPFANAVNLSKLTLIDGDALNALASKRRMNSPDFLPNGRYRSPYRSDEPAGAILLGAIRSIDGNHQWQAIAPPLPEAQDHLENRATSVNCQRFGYRAGGKSYPTPLILASVVDPDNGEPYCATDNEGYAAQGKSLPARKRGLPFWHVRDLRQTVFNCVFKGPLSKGVCSALDGEAALRHGCLGEPYPPSLGETLIEGPACLLEPVAARNQSPRMPRLGTPQTRPSPDVVKPGTGLRRSTVPSGVRKAPATSTLPKPSSTRPPDK